MARKVFVSYKYADSDVQSLNSYSYTIYTSPATTVRDYVNRIENRMNRNDFAIYKGEQNNQDLSYLSDNSIWNKLKDRIYDSSVTIVLISKGMRDPFYYDREQWIPWEIYYSLRNQSRDGRTSHSNALLFVILPDKFGSYDYFYHMQHFKIVKDNIDNDYAEVVRWSSFYSNMEYYINRAITKKSYVPDSMISKVI